MADRAPVLEIRGARKSYGAVQALDGVDLTLHDGEIVALLGDNGAGKSTLIKAISGVHQLDGGAIAVDGAPARLRSPVDARRLGIETVYQDLALFDNLSPIANFFAGRELRRPRGVGSMAFLRERSMARRWRELAEELGVHIRNPSLPVALMSGGQRQAVAVARAVAFAARVVVLDEPTAALGVREAGNVLRLVEQLPRRGLSVILISHNLEHVMRVADRAVVLRRGRNVGEAIPSADNHERLVSLIVGSQTRDAHASSPAGLSMANTNHEHRGE